MSAGDADDTLAPIPSGLVERTRALVVNCQINRQYRVYTLANRTRDGRIVYIDNLVPAILPMSGVDTGASLPYHELAELLLMDDGMAYIFAHHIANSVERSVVGPDLWPVYSQEMDRLINLIEWADKDWLDEPPDQDQRVLPHPRRHLTKRLSSYRLYS
jgi:hypothetical protein